MSLRIRPVSCERLEITTGHRLLLSARVVSHVGELRCHPFFYAPMIDMTWF